VLGPPLSFLAKRPATCAILAARGQVAVVPARGWVGEMPSRGPEMLQRPVSLPSAGPRRLSGLGYAPYFPIVAHVSRRPTRRTSTGDRTRAGERARFCRRFTARRR
jgi:hypothetical protein